MKENLLFFGFKSMKELFVTAFGIKTLSVSVIFSVLSTINGFIQEYIYDDAKAVYFLIFLIAIDAITGIWKALKAKVFSSSKLPRILVLMILYILILGIGWNAARFSSFYFWLPSVIYGGMIGTLIVSVFENFMELGYLPKNLYDSIKKKIFSTLSLKEKKEATKKKK